MAKTLISDILKPDVWNTYGIQRTMELSALIASGIAAPVPGITLPNGGGTINLPFFNDLSGASQNLSDSASLTVNNITTAKDVAVVIGRGNAWSVNDLAAVFSGADPARAIMDLLAAYWSRQNQAELLSVLKGAFLAASMSGNVHDVSAGASEDLRCFNVTNFTDAVYKLGDAASQVTGVMMHSATMAYLVKKNAITFVRPSDNAIDIPTYMGKRVIVDDSLPVATGTYTSYVFGPSAIGYDVAPIGPQELETDRDILAGDTVMTMRMKFLMHPRGIKWQGTPAGAFPTRTELETGTNWARVYENKAIRIVQFKHKNA